MLVLNICSCHIIFKMFTPPLYLVLDSHKNLVWNTITRNMHKQGIKYGIEQIHLNQTQHTTNYKLLNSFNKFEIFYLNNEINTFK